MAAPTDSVEYGISLPFSSDLASFARTAENLGFDYVASGEHFAFHVPTPNSLMSLAVAAGATRNIKLLSSVTLLPLYPPPLLAKMIASFDVVCGGRFNLGVGIGGEHATDFQLLGVPRHERAARADEALEVIDLLLTRSQVTFEGRFTKLKSASLGVAPVQRPRVPFWVCGRKRPAMARAVRHGAVWMPYLYTPDQLSASLGTLDELSEAAGYGAWSGSAAVYLHTTVYEDGDKARLVGAESVGGTYRQDFSTLGHFLLAGDPVECRARLADYLAAGATKVIFRLACPSEDLDAMVQLLQDEVVDKLRRGQP